MVYDRDRVAWAVLDEDMPMEPLVDILEAVLLAMKRREAMMITTDNEDRLVNK